MFHMLQPAEQGGESTFLDGFHAARQLLVRHPEAYETLSTIRTDAAARGDAGIHIRPAHPYPIFNHLPKNTPSDQSSRVGRLFQIRYNHDDRAPLKMSADEARAYYQALRLWQERVRDPANVLRLSLQPGRVVCFDNWRVLHGREAFTGQRRLCGAYIGADDWRSRLRALREKASIYSA
jgi:trimethyllysine dioxygenase